MELSRAPPWSSQMFSLDTTVNLVVDGSVSVIRPPTPDTRLGAT
jgi:hypothetical protein